MSTDKKRKGWHEGHVRERLDGRYEGRITIDGKTKSVYGKSNAEVKRKMKEFKKEVLANKVNPKTELLYTYSLQWLKDNKLGKVEPSYYDRLETVVENQIKNSKIANKQVGKIKAEELQALLDDLAKPTQNNKAYSHSTIKKVYEFLAMMYRDIFTKGMLVENPMVTVNLPRKNSCVIEKKETFSLNEEQIKKLKAQCLTREKNGLYKYRYGLCILFILNTGLRIGEFLALEMADIHLEERYIVINKSLQSNVKTRNGEGNKRVSNIKEPKTKNGIRYLPINDEILFIVNEIVKDNEVRGIKTDYVCSTANGTQANARNLQRSLDVLSEKAGLPHVWLHLLRHTFGSTLIRKNIDITVVSKLLGHANTNITYQHYIHVIEEQKVKAMNLISIS